MSGRTPTEEQRAAIAAERPEVLVEAGAGTGKTGVMVDRYCRLVCEEGVSPDAVLAFTFTDKAAGELRQRIRAEVEGRAEAGEGRAREVLPSLGGAWVTTIHGFCNRLLSAHPVAVGVDPRFRVLDAPEAGRAADEAFDQALEQFLAAGGDEREETLAAFDVAGLRSVVTAAHAELRSRGEAEPVLPPAPEPNVPAALAAAAAAARDCLAEVKPGSAPTSSSRGRSRLLDGDPDLDLEKVSALRTESKAKTIAPYREAIEAAVSRVAEAGEGGRAYRHVAELLTLFSGQFAAAKERRSGVDFEDLQILAVRLLERTETGAAYQARFSHLLVDEFQDTNRLQLRLVEALRGPGSQLMVVGDELQSIYGFRHADLDVFRERRQRIAAAPEGEAIQLSGNFRSRPEVIGAVNELGAELLKDAYTPLRVGAAPSSSGPPGEGPSVELLLTAARRLGRGRDRARTADRRPHPDQPAGRGPVPCRAPARARRAGRRARLDGRPAARLHPPRRPRGLARARRPAALRGRRARLLVPAAGRRRLRPAGDDRQPARRPGAARVAGLAGGRGCTRHALAAAGRRRPRAPALAGDRGPRRHRRGRGRRHRATGPDPRPATRSSWCDSRRRSPAFAPTRSRCRWRR